MDRKPELTTIALIEDADNCCDVKTGEAVPFYTYDANGYGDKVVRRDAELATLEQLAHLCDHDAENCNAHDYCGAHRLLAAVLYRQLGRLVATNVMRDIAYRRGLHGMAGLSCGAGDSYEELGVGKAGYEWYGSFGS